jgi:hypothetical protein
MATAPTQAPLQPSFSAREALELVPKLAAAALFLVYVCGFLITSLHTSAYGFISTNPFRPRILSAGTWFLTLTGVPVLTAAAIWKRFRENSAGASWLRLVEQLWMYYVFCVLLAVLSFRFFEYPAPAPFRFTLRDWTMLAAWVVAAITISVGMSVKWRPARICAGVAFVGWILCSYFVAIDRLYKGGFDFSHVALWFFGIGAFTLLEFYLSTINPLRWAPTIFIGLAVLGGFARLYYPRIKGSWGGGSPSPVTVYLAKEAPVFAGKQLKGTLVDESDAGFYFVPGQESRAMFIPRSAVSLIYFSDGVPDSTMPRGGTSGP